MRQHNQSPKSILAPLSIGGWGGWNYAIGSSMLLKNAGGDRITTYCVLDSDYHTQQEISEKLASASDKEVQLHIWHRKEIENYLLVPEAIMRVITSQIAKRTEPPAINEVKAKLDEFTEALKDETFDALASEYLARNRSEGAAGANKAARNRIMQAWETFEGRLSVVSGKRMIAMMSDWSQREFGAFQSPERLARNLRKNEIDPEVIQVATSIEQGAKFSA